MAQSSHPVKSKPAPQPKFSGDDLKKIAAEMTSGRYGGFATSLGTTLRRADDGNAAKLAAAFPFEFEGFLQMANLAAKSELVK
jgi:hypothetical protein